MDVEITETTLFRPKGVRFWKPSRVYAKGQLLDGKRHGRWVFWYESGAKQLQGTYLEGEKHGFWTKWWEDGAKQAEGTCVHGKMDGKWIEWHPNGQKARESYWVKGKKDGRWQYWRPDGTLEHTETYDHHSEAVQKHAVCTDLDARNIIKQVQKDALDRNWEKMVGRTIAGLVKPWHIACWILIFVIGMGLTREGPKGRGIALAAIVALLITSLLEWVTDKNNR